MAAVRSRRARRAGRDQRDRGRHRHPERDRDGDRGGRPLRALAAAPAARPRRPRRARVLLPAVLGLARPSSRSAGWRRSAASATGSSWPRSTSRCAARATCSARSSPGCPSSGSLACRRTTTCSSARGAGDRDAAGRSGARAARARLLRDAILERASARSTPSRSLLRRHVRVVAGSYKRATGLVGARTARVDEADPRPGPRGAFSMLGLGRRGAGARPLCRLRGARDRGALAGGGRGDVRRLRRPRAAGRAREPGRGSASRTPRLRRVRVRRGAFLRQAAAPRQRWDLVFCDPPYRLAHRLAARSRRAAPTV